jgi:hypothetical protein
MENSLMAVYRRRPMARPTNLGTVAGMTGLIGILPLLLTLWLAMSFESLSALALTAIHMGLMGLGAWLFAEWF